VAPRDMQFESPVSSFARGCNTVELSIAQDGPQTIIWTEVRIEP
jgi:hypothetical protein